MKYVTGVVLLYFTCFNFVCGSDFIDNNSIYDRLLKGSQSEPSHESAPGNNFMQELSTLEDYSRIYKNLTYIIYYNRRFPWSFNKFHRITKRDAAIDKVKQISEEEYNEFFNSDSDESFISEEEPVAITQDELVKFLQSLGSTESSTEETTIDICQQEENSLSTDNEIITQTSDNYLDVTWPKQSLPSSFEATPEATDFTSPSTESLSSVDTTPESTEFTSPSTESLSSTEITLETTDFTSPSTESLSSVDTTPESTEFTSPSTESLSSTEITLETTDFTSPSTELLSSTEITPETTEFTSPSTESLSSTKITPETTEFSSPSTESLSSVKTTPETTEFISPKTESLSSTEITLGTTEFTSPSTESLSFTEITLESTEFTSSSTESLSSTEITLVTIEFTSPSSESLSSLETTEFTSPSTESLSSTELTLETTEFTSPSAESLSSTELTLETTEFTSPSTESLSSTEITLETTEFTSPSTESLSSTELTLETTEITSPSTESLSSTELTLETTEITSPSTESLSSTELTLETTEITSPSTESLSSTEITLETTEITSPSTESLSSTELTLETTEITSPSTESLSSTELTLETTEITSPSTESLSSTELTLKTTEITSPSTESLSSTELTLETTEFTSRSSESLSSDETTTEFTSYSSESLSPVETTSEFTSGSSESLSSVEITTEFTSGSSESLSSVEIIPETTSTVATPVIENRFKMSNAPETTSHSIKENDVTNKSVVLTRTTAMPMANGSNESPIPAIILVRVDTLSRKFLIIMQQYSRSVVVTINENTPFLDPLPINDLRNVFGVVTISFTNLRMFGFNAYEVKFGTIDENRMVIPIFLMVKLVIRGTYEARTNLGNIFGQFSITWHAYCSSVATLEPNKDGRLYITNPTIQIRVKNVRSEFKGFMLPKFLNAVGGFFLKTLKPQMQERFRLIIINGVNSEMKTVLYERTKHINNIQIALAEGRRYCRVMKYDPYYMNAFSLQQPLGYINFYDFWLTGMSQFYPVGGLYFSRLDSQINLIGLTVATGQLFGTCNWYGRFVNGVLGGGKSNFTIDYLQVRVTIAQSEYYQQFLRLHHLSIRLGRIYITTRSHNAENNFLNYVIKSTPGFIKYVMLKDLREILKERVLIIIKDLSRVL